MSTNSSYIGDSAETLRLFENFISEFGTIFALFGK